MEFAVVWDYRSAQERSDTPLPHQSVSMQWFLNTAPRPAARLRLICLPYAGAGAAVYRSWHSHLPADVDVQSVQLPGRGWRVRETPGTDLIRIAEEVTEAVQPLTDRPIVLFGHSFGAWLGLLVARRLEALGEPPVALIASGRRSPSHPRSDAPMRHLDDPGFVEEIQSRYGAIHPDIVGDEDILKLLLPALRSDVAALESYEHSPEPRVECPVIAMGGRRDPVVPVDELDSWRQETGGAFEVESFSGGHFYFEDDPEPLLASLRARIAGGWLAGVGSS